jgi:molybdenum cofactor biosynthesis protein B
VAKISGDRPFLAVNIAVMTVSDSRTLDNDTSGQTLVERIAAAGHKVAAREIVKDEVPAIVAQLRRWIADPAVDAVIATGGTGVTGRDVTPEAFAQVVEKDIPGFGELFRMLSYEQIGAAAMLSRACAGVSQCRVIIALPGSEAAIRLALDKLVLPELGHLVREATR